MASIYPTGTTTAVRHQDHYDILPTSTYTTGATYLGGGATNYSAGTQYISGGSQARYNGTTTYVGGPTYVTGGSAVRQAVGVPTTSYVTGGSYYGGATSGAHLQGGYIGGSVARRPATEDIPVESRIEYIPFETKHIEYDSVERVERIPYEREIVEYEEITRIERVPVERTITDYYAVETQIEYIPK